MDLKIPVLTQKEFSAHIYKEISDAITNRDLSANDVMNGIPKLDMESLQPFITWFTQTGVLNFPHKLFAVHSNSTSIYWIISYSSCMTAIINQ